ncbi:MAG: phosphotransferase enzyme family protein, partial [Pseudomonadales bacterium]
ASGRDCVLQGINARVFTEAALLCEQLGRVVTHLNEQQSGWVPDLIATQAGNSFVQADDRVWRLWQFVPGETLQLDHCAPALRLARLRAAGQAFASTQVMLESLPGKRLQPAIGHYHDLSYHLQRYDDLHGARNSLPAQWRERVALFREQPFGLLASDGYIHGDCKPDNLLYRAGSAEVAAVLDLDTVMWGSRALDFGDLVRSSVWVNEQFDEDSFDALLQGFVDGQRSSAQPCSARKLSAAPVYVSFMLSLRYLLDHLSGDREFKVTQPGDNLGRAERQFQRTLQLDEARDYVQSQVQVATASDPSGASPG